MVGREDSASCLSRSVSGDSPFRPCSKASCDVTVPSGRGRRERWTGPSGLVIWGDTLGWGGACRKGGPGVKGTWGCGLRGGASACLKSPASKAQPAVLSAFRPWSMAMPRSLLLPLLPLLLLLLLPLEIPRAARASPRQGSSEVAATCKVGTATRRRGQGQASTQATSHHSVNSFGELQGRAQGHPPNLSSGDWPCPSRFAFTSQV